MRAQTVARLLAIVILSLLLSIFIDQYQIAKRDRGKQAFIADQSHRFDRFYARPRPFPLGPIIIFTTGIIGSYELLSFAIYKTIRLLGFSDDFTRSI
jgi:hypothetical protein